jgi:parallel beta-helix repeat protein
MRSITALMMIMMILLTMTSIHDENGNASQSEHKSTISGRDGSIGPILILNDSAFDQKAEEMNWTGNGSESDPYVIENLDLNANGSGYGIGISTTYYFTIRNCSIRKADGGGAPLGAISILSGKGTIMDCRINSSGYGIRSLSPCRIINNTIFDCHNGLWILNDDNEVFGNLIIDGANHAIHFQGDDSLIKENTVRNWDYGIYLIGGERNRVQDNSVTNIDDHGIRLDNSHNNTVIDNYAANNDDGIFLKYGSSNNRISNNSIVSCEEGIYIFDAIQNEFYGNEMFNCSFYFEMGRDNFVSHTIPDNNTVGGNPVVG